MRPPRKCSRTASRSIPTRICLAPSWHRLWAIWAELKRLVGFGESSKKSIRDTHWKITLIACHSRMPRMPKELSRAYARQACRLWPTAPPDCHRRLPARSGAKAGDVVGPFKSIIDHDITVLDKATRAQALRNENMCCRSASAELRTKGDRYLRSLLVTGATAVVRQAQIC